MLAQVARAGPPRHVDLAGRRVAVRTRARADDTVAIENVHFAENARQATFAGVEGLRCVGRGRVAEHRMIEMLWREGGSKRC